MSELEALFSLKGKVALVTGASAGLGVEFAKAMAKAGADVAVLARRLERLEALAKDVEALGVRCLPVAADLSDNAGIEQAVTRIEADLGPVDILINNAGVAPLGAAERHKPEDWEGALRVNLTAPFLLAQRVARVMIERGSGGRIINIGSVMGAAANPIFNTVSYTASKGGVHLMTKQLAIEWAKHDITVNCIAPAWFPTEMNIDPRVGDIKADHKARMEAFTPMSRVGREGELTAAAIFFASPAASYVTGTVLPVDGGWLAW